MAGTGGRRRCGVVWARPRIHGHGWRADRVASRRSTRRFPVVAPGEVQMKSLAYRYRVAIVAAAGLAVAAVAAVTTAPAALAATGCRVDYAISSQWPGGFGANVTVTNLG